MYLYTYTVHSCAHLFVDFTQPDKSKEKKNKNNKNLPFLVATRLCASESLVHFFQGGGEILGLILPLYATGYVVSDFIPPHEGGEG